MGTTSVYGLHYPASTDDVRVSEDIQTLAEDAETGLKALGVVRWGDRATSSATTTTEVGVLRLDNVPVVSGFAYRIWTEPLFLTGTQTADVLGAGLRISTSGSATTSSSQLAQAQMIVSNIVFPPVMPGISALYVPGSTGTLSVLLSARRVTGTGFAQISAASGVRIRLVVERVGPDPGDSGIDI